jgi:polysaccharide biosynthesis/export protein
MSKKEILLTMLFVLFSTHLVGCFSSHPKDIRFFTKPDEKMVTFNKYVLKPADVIEIHCTKIPELDLQKIQIRPDGRVSFEGIGDVDAAGKTPDELASALHEKALLLYSLAGDHPIDVRVVTYKSAYFYVLGQVYFEGPKPCTGRDTVLASVAAARPNKFAWVRRIQVIRPSADKKSKPKIFEVNYDKMAAHGDISKDVLLEEGDIVYVPPTVLSGAGFAVGEFFGPIGQSMSAVNVINPATAP